MARHDLPTFLAATVDNLARELSQLLAEGEAVSVEAAEEQLGRTLSAVGRAAMRALLEGKDPGGADIQVAGTRYWQAARASRSYMTQFGTVSVMRGVFRAVRNGPTVCPMECRAGIVEHFWTPRAAKLALLAVADMTSYRASRFFAELGAMQPSRSSLDRLPKDISRRWEADRQRFEGMVREADSIPAEAKSVAVSVDGVLLPMRAGGKHATKARARAAGKPDKGPAGYREAGCASLSYYDARGTRLKTVRFGRMPERKMATIQGTVRTELAYVRAQRPDLTVVAVADGDPVLWEFLDTLKPDKSIVDFYHAAEHLKHAIDLTAEPSSVKNQRRFARLRRCLKNQRAGVQTVIRSLRRSKPRRTSEVALYRRGIGYFRRHAGRMNYPSLQHSRLPIGSGVVEGTCRWLVSDRMKRTGMRWDSAGGQAILTVRALVHSERFTNAWTILGATYQQPC